MKRLDRSLLTLPSLKAYLPRKGGFVSNVITLATGTTFAQALVIVSTPIVTRLYSPEDFGLLALFLSITNILTVVASWRYELAIVLPKEDSGGINLLSLSCLITLGMSGLALLVIALLGDKICRLMNAPGLAPWLWWAPSSLLLAGAFQAITYWNTRKKQFALQAAAQFGKSAGTVGVQIALGISAAGSSAGLVAGTLAGQLVGAGILAEHLCRHHGRFARETISGKAMFEQMVRHKKFPFLTNFAGLVNQLAYQIPVWLLSVFYGPQLVGFYMLAQRAAGLPAALIGRSVSQVFFQRAAEEYKATDGSVQTYRKTLLLLFILTVPAFFVLMIFGPFLFTFILGPAWAQAGRFAAILAPIFCMSLIMSPLSLVNAVHERQEVGLLWQIGLAVLSALTLSVSHHYGLEVYDAMKVFSCALFIWYLLLMLVTYRIATNAGRHKRLL